MRCKRNNSEKCFHWAVGDESTIEYFQTLLENEHGEFLRSCGATLNEIKKQSKIKYNPTAIDKEVDIYNIEFAPSGEESDAEIEKLFFFNTLVTEELTLHNMPIKGTLGERRERLRKQLLVEERIIFMQLAVQRREMGREAAMMLIQQAIPCIMHLENRSGEKILTMLLSIRAEMYQKRQVGAALKMYLEQVQQIVRTVILGMPWRPKAMESTPKRRWG
jgi:hypothetical protein